MYNFSIFKIKIKGKDHFIKIKILLYQKKILKIVMFSYNNKTLVYKKTGVIRKI
jgi:hypothetical protein